MNISWVLNLSSNRCTTFFLICWRTLESESGWRFFYFCRFLPLCLLTWLLLSWLSLLLFFNCSSASQPHLIRSLISPSCFFLPLFFLDFHYLTFTEGKKHNVPGTCKASTSIHPTGQYVHCYKVCKHCLLGLPNANRWPIEDWVVLQL